MMGRVIVAVCPCASGETSSERLTFTQNVADSPLAMGGVVDELEKPAVAQSLPPDGATADWISSAPESAVLDASVIVAAPMTASIAKGADALVALVTVTFAWMGEVGVSPVSSPSSTVRRRRSLGCR